MPTLDQETFDRLCETVNDLKEKVRMLEEQDDEKVGDVEPETPGEASEKPRRDSHRMFSSTAQPS